MKAADCPSWVEYKKARANFQSIYRQESVLKTIRENNLIMQADHNNKKVFFNKIKELRSNKYNTSPKVLNTPTGTYYGSDTLEGFTADAEILGKAVGETAEFDNHFYKLSILDNHYIFYFKGNEPVNIPEMRIEDLEQILTKDMKLKKACDIYRLTVEHLRYAGLGAKLVILKLVNDIIQNIYYLTCQSRAKQCCL